MLPDRITSKVKPSGECHVWTGATQRNGYGYTRWKRDGEWINVRVHRLFYEDANGPISKGLEIDHLCRNRGCVRPEHLRAVTHAENLRTRDHRGHAPWETCKAGHPFTEASTYIAPNGLRSCRICRTERVREWRARQAG